MNPVLLHSYRKKKIEAFDWYISPTGNDTTGDGSIDTPYLTPGKAISVASSGQKIGCLGGTYRQWGIAVNKAVTIKAVPGHTPVLYNSYELTSWSKTDGRTNVYEATATQAVCTACWNGNTSLTSKDSAELYDGTTNSFYFDGDNDKLYVNIGGSAPTSIEASPISHSIGFNVSVANVSLYGLTFGYSTHVCVYSNAANCTVSWATIRNCALHAIQLDSNGCVLENSNIQITSACSTFNGANCIARNNYLKSGAQGILSYGANFNAQYNTFEECNDGVSIPGGSATICYNTAINTKHGAYFVKDATGTIHHNIAYNTKDIGGTNYGVITESSSTTYVYNNTVANLLNNPTGTIIMGHIVIIGTCATTVRNNIFYKCYYGARSAEDTHTVDSDYNCFYGNTVNYLTYYPQGAHDILVDPLLTNEATFDYTLQSGSPCIDAGAVVAGITDGYQGTAPDIGRHEKA